ncbi:MAG: hypothetical protein IJR89_03115 [Clostridia bacterium]|nr:hypothetical protein [Clostridia bacterium]
MKGIDVSLWQGEIDWNAVKADGVSFAMIKASEGGAGDPAESGTVDPRFRQNIENASAAGIACGVYHYLTAKTPEQAREEADFFLKTIRPFAGRIALWAAADMETAAGMDRTALTDTVLSFLRRVEEGGFSPMLYANTDYIRNRYDYARLAAYPLWYACWYDAAGEEERPERTFSYAIWQQGAGRVAGVSGACDVDYGTFSLPREETPEEGQEDPAAEETPAETSAQETSQPPAESAAPKGTRLAKILCRILRFLLRLLGGESKTERRTP